MLLIRALTLLIAAALWLAAVPPAHAATCGNGVINSDEQCDDGNASPGDGCAPNCTIYPGWSCSGSPSVCIDTNHCGNGIVDSDEECDDGNRAIGDGCNFACRIQEGWICNGEPSVCAGQDIEPSCGNGELAFGETCDDGNTVSDDGCSDDCLVEAGFNCSGEPSVCTQAGSIEDCGNGTTEAGESCDGGACCNSDCTFKSSTATCRAPSGSCDEVERCTGSSSACPADSLKSGGTVCRDAVSTACDVAESCSGTSGDCPADVLLNCNDTDGIECTQAACTSAGECIESAGGCDATCRQANFWARRSSVGQDAESVVDLVLDEVGSLSVCGQTIDSSTDLGTLDSAIEALCVRPQGVDERELFRALVVAVLNCSVSVGANCDAVLSGRTEVSFTDCNNLCAGNPAPGGPTAEECIDQLECFNEGGLVVDGQCAKGTCTDDPTELCGGDFGSCDDGVSAPAPSVKVGGDDEADDDEDGDCQSFEDSCAGGRFCSTDTTAPAQVCPGKTRPTNNKICRDARLNDCTIDSCD